MPLITAKFYEGRLNAQTEPKLVEALTDALVSVFGPEIREQTWVVLEETSAAAMGCWRSYILSTRVRRGPALDDSGSFRVRMVQI